MKSRNKGFTLVEVLIVVAIVGMLATFALVSYRNSLKKARDNKRITDINSIILALELYKDKNGCYPGPDPNHGGIPNGGFKIESNPAAGTVAEDFNNELKDYISSMPQDPLDDGSIYYYAYDPNHCAPSMVDNRGAVIGIRRFDFLGQDKQTSCGGNHELDQADYNRVLGDVGCGS